MTHNNRKFMPQTRTPAILFQPLLLLTAGLLLSLVPLTLESKADELLVGAASADITPTGPVTLLGPFRVQISKKPETPLVANVLVLESRQGGKSLDTAVMIACDLGNGPMEIVNLVREEVRKLLPDLDTKKIILSGTHIHTGPFFQADEESHLYPIPKEGVIQVKEYQAFLVRRIADAVARAWNSRTPGSVTWGLGHAVVAYNRRTVYADGSAKMYGNTNTPEFRNIEGYEDHDVGTLFFWNKADELITIVANVSCPAQEVEGSNEINADYWHPVRELLHKRYGRDVCVLGWIGAAGDQSPHLMYRKAADNRMTRLRGLTRLQEIARRIDRAVEESHDAVKNDRHTDVPLIHKVEIISLPARVVTDAEYTKAKAVCQRHADIVAKNPKADKSYIRMNYNEGVVRAYESQKGNPKPVFEVELHVLRIGDAVVCTNPFELFTDYGIQIKARSKAVQTFVVQLANGPGNSRQYLPTEKAVRAGDYGTAILSCYVTPDGGQILVDRTVEIIDSLWAKPK